MILREEPKEIVSSSPRIAAESPDVASVRPRLIENTGTWCLFPANGLRKAVYIIGSKKTNRFITVPGHALASVQAALELFDGKHTLREIEDHVRNSQQFQIEAEELYKLLAQSGLLHGQEGRALATDIERMSLRILDLPVDRLTERGYGAIRKIALLSFPFTVLILFWFGLDVLFFSPPAGAPAFPPVIGWVSLLILITIVTVHEGAHAIVAAYFEISIIRFRIALYLGIIPFFYLRLGGLYTASIAKRIMVWLAGIYANVVFGCALLLLARHFAVSPALESTLRKGASLNYILAAINLIPFIPTDGYYIASTLLKRHNVRAHAWGLLSSLIHGKPVRQFSMLAAGYLLMSLALIGWMIVKETRIILEARTTGFAVALVSFFIVCAFVTNWYRRKGAIRSRLLTFAINWLAIGGALYISGTLQSLKEIFSRIL